MRLRANRPKRDSNPIPLELTLFPHYDLYYYCVNSFLVRYSIVGYSNRFGKFENVKTWAELLPQAVLSPVPSVTTSAARALVTSSCNYMFKEGDLAQLGSQWYVHSLRCQKELVNLITSHCWSGFRTSRQSESASEYIVALDECSASPSDRIAMSSSFQRLVNWASNDPSFSSEFGRDQVRVQDASAVPPDLPNVLPDNNVTRMRGNMMSLVDDSITASLLLALNEAISSASNPSNWDSPVSSAGQLNSSWRSLVQGMIGLIRLRAAEAYLNGFNSTLFRSLREMIAVYSLLARKKNSSLTGNGRTFRVSMD